MNISNTLLYTVTPMITFGLLVVPMISTQLHQCLRELTVWDWDWDWVCDCDESLEGQNREKYLYMGVDLIKVGTSIDRYR